MPVQELPEEFFCPFESPSNSSLSSNSSDVILINAHYDRRTSSRLASISSNTTTTQEDSLEAIENVGPSIDRDRNRVNNNEDELKYEQIKLPTEPTLEELLRQVIGNDNIRSVEQIKLRIISSAISLHRLPYFLPYLRVLNLEGSMLFSLRDLGCNLSSLVYLNISRCGLTSLDGTNGLSSLTELIVDYNLIEDAGPCSNIPNIKKISLTSNKIKEYQGMMFLSLCYHLKVLDMTENPISHYENYREAVKQNIPSLVFLDKLPFETVDEMTKIELLRSEYQSENNGLRRSSNQTVRVLTGMSNWNRSHLSNVRAVDSPVTCHVSIGKRPKTVEADRKYDVSVGEPVCGNIITKARRPRKLKTAWGDSCSSSSFSSSDSSAQSTPKTKQIVGIGISESSEELLESSRLWREKSKASRDSLNY